MKLPKVLVNHYVHSANVSNSSIMEESPYNMFESQELNASKSIPFSGDRQENQNTSTDMSQPAERLAVLNGRVKNSIPIKVEGEKKKSKFRI